MNVELRAFANLENLKAAGSTPAVGCFLAVFAKFHEV